MADSPSTPPADLSVIFNTLRFLHRTKRLYQFQAKGHSNRRKQHEAAEAEARSHVKRLNLRIQREIDAHPEIVQGLPGDWED